ncbi:unnamed protein product [Orchesella dallaii]|uniref:Uncharacterized protein n=1 Tax=Orchesella dallaii TaxID=48710 RepID=A0ABP1PJ01_9HEXA
MFSNWFHHIFVSTLCLSLSIILSFVFCYRNASFEQGLTNLQLDGISRPQILSWWNAHQRDLANIRNSTRVFPICITRNENGHYPPRMERWGRILDHMALKDERVYDKDRHSSRFWRHKDGKGFEKARSQIFLYSVYINHISNFEKDPDKDKEYDLHNWLYVHIRNFYQVKGIYVQLMAGPLGVPAGEFVTTLTCSQTPVFNPHWNPDFVKGHFLVPCSYAPRSTPSSLWPNTFMYDGEPTKDFAFQIRRNEAQCGEFGFFQLVIILTRNFQPDQPNDYKAILMPVYEDHLIGAGTYIQPTGGIDIALHCNVWTRGRFNVLQRIVPDKKYDDCITKRTGREEGLMGWTCPPGPFECDTTWSSWDVWSLKVNYSMDILKAHQIGPPKDRDCCEIGEIPEIIWTTEPPGPTETTETPAPVPAAAKEKELSKKTKQAERQRTGDNRLGDVPVKHFLLGFICTALQHIGVFTALKLFRNVRESFAFVYLASHSLGGKLAYIVAFFAIILSSSNLAMKGISFALVCIYIIVVGVTMFYENKQENILGLNFHRAACPVLQRIVMEHRKRPPMTKQKVVVLLVMVGSLFGLYIFMELVFRDIKTKEAQ